MTDKTPLVGNEQGSYGSQQPGPYGNGAPPAPYGNQQPGPYGNQQQSGPYGGQPQQQAGPYGGQSAGPYNSTDASQQSFNGPPPPEGQGPQAPPPGINISEASAPPEEGGEEEMIMPSMPYAQIPTNVEPGRTVSKPSPPYLDNGAVQTALVDQMDSSCCAGTDAAKSMTILNTSSENALYYVFETFTEARSTQRVTEAYRIGQDVDGPERGIAPGPWEIPVRPSTNFQKGIHRMPVPHTSTVHLCNRCMGTGWHRCHSCHGRGRDRCNFCSGSGRRREPDGTHRNCHHCHGSGSARCHHCHGHGRVRCHRCHGSGYLVSYIQLTVKWEVHLTDQFFAEELLGCPVDDVKKGTGPTLLQEEMPRLPPLQGSTVSKLDNASRMVVEQHGSAWPNQFILMQRHRVVNIPVIRASCQWKEKTFNYWIVGENRKVISHEYPQSGCCWCCNIL